MARDHFAFDGDDVFAADVVGLGVGFGIGFFIEDDLHDAGAIADVEEEEIAEVATLGDPAEDDGVFAGVGGAKGAAVVCAFEIAEEIEHGALVLCLGASLVLDYCNWGRGSLQRVIEWRPEEKARNLATRRGVRLPRRAEATP